MILFDGVAGGIDTFGMEVLVLVMDELGSMEAMPVVSVAFWNILFTLSTHSGAASIKRSRM